MDIDKDPVAAYPVERRWLDWKTEDFSGFGRQFVAASHRLHEETLFGREAIVNLIDRYPRAQLQAFTMGDDPTRMEELIPVDTAGAGGEEILEAVRRGKLWFKLQRIDTMPGYGDIVRELYEEIAAGHTAFRAHQWSAVLLFGSTNSHVYFHVDAKPNMIWHIWGRKRIWLYPPPDDWDSYLVDQDMLEDIYASVRDEETEYCDSFDQYASVFDLEPGDVLSWPQNSPHRVQVLEGISLSLSTFYDTDQSIRRGEIYGMNRVLRVWLGAKRRSVAERGVVPMIKSLGFRILRRAGVLERASRRPYETDLKIDGDSVTGVSAIPTGPRLTEFAKGSDL